MTRDQYAADRNRASYHWQATRDGLIVATEYGPDGVTEYKLAELDKLPKPYILHAMAYRATEFPNYTIEIQNGMEPIWEHCVIHPVDVMTGQSPGTFEALIFGRTHPPDAQGKRAEEVMLVLWTGDVAGFNSREEAKAIFQG